MIAVIAAVLAVALTGGGDSSGDASAATTDLSAFGSPVLQRVDPATNELIVTVPVAFSSEDPSERPKRTAAAAGGVWSVSPDDGGVQRLNADTNAIDRFVGVRGSPSGVAADGEVIWVVSELDDEATLTKIDNATGERLGEISLGTMLPRSVAAGEGSVWVGGHGFGEVFGQKPGLSGGVLVRVDRDTEAATAIPLGAVPQDVAAGEGFAWAVGSVPFNNDVFLVERIDPLNNTVAQVEVQLNTENPEKAGTLAAGEGFIWLTGHTDSLKRIDPRTLAVENVELDLDSSGREPTRVAVGHGSVWVTTDPGRPDTAGAPPATLSRLDPVTGDVLAMIVVGPVADIVTVGEDAVWVEACPQKEGPLGRTGCSQETTVG